MSFISVASHIAPRLYHRRAIRIYFFPWVIFLCSVLLAVISLSIGTNPLHVALLIGTLFVCFALKDLTSPHSLIARLIYWAGEKFGIAHGKRADLTEARIVYLAHPYPPLFTHRVSVRWTLYLIIIFVIAMMALYQSAHPPTAPAAQRGLVTTIILMLGLIPFSRFVALPTHFSRPYQIVVWSVIISASSFLVARSFYNLVPENKVLIGVGTILLPTIALAFFVTQRLWVDRYGYHKVASELTRNLLRWPQKQGNLNGVAARIGMALRYDRVFILERDGTQSELRIIDQFGANRPFHGQRIPLEKSICGRAFRDGEAYLWNDVSVCPYHFAVPEDDTAAEIAIPIAHQGTLYGILDIQSIQEGAFGPSDLEALESLASALGTALAASRSTAVFDEALSLWQRIAEATSAPFSSEKQVFELFADFAQEILEADLVIYFPLSLADCPIQEPFTRGRFLYSPGIQPPRNDPASSLTHLIRKWQPYFEAEVTDTSLVARSAGADDGGFVNREKIRSTCFIPIGMEHERLGALFLNFREVRQFDKAAQFTILSLAQALAKVTSQIRYRTMFSESFGRPEIGLHAILSRAGFKEGIIKRAKGLRQTGGCGTNCCDSIQECAFFPLFNDMEDFLTEISLAKSSIPPSFWDENLSTRLHTYKSDMPYGANGRRPQIDLQIDGLVERENPWVKLALYRLVTEAVNNAVLHGNATRIVVYIMRSSTSIEVEVRNNGKSLPKDAQKHKRDNGIFTLLEEFEKEFGAEHAEIRSAEDEPGVVVHVSVPALPSVDLENKENIGI